MRRADQAAAQSPGSARADGGVSWLPPLQLTPQTADPAEAQRRFEEYAAADVGVEGLL